MVLLGLDITIWVVLLVYLLGMLALGWWSKRGAHSQEGYLLGNRRFGSFMMVMHSFGAGTHPGAPAGVISKTVSAGASGIWVSWVWMFGTPFYWLVAPVIRRMRYLTMADYFERRFSRAASTLYVVVAAVGMTVMLASVLLATTRTVQGIMGKADAGNTWFFGILLTVAAVFIIYSYWGGIIAAIRTDMIQGLMIIALSFIAIPAALRLSEVGGMDGVRETLATENSTYLQLFDVRQFNMWAVLLLSVNAPLSMLAMPHLMSVCGAGRSEWEGRVGFTYGNILKRLCTIGWCVLGLAWLAYLIKTESAIHPDAAFGDCIRGLLSPALQGVMLACVMAAAMSSGDAVQVTLGGLFSQNIYRPFINPQASGRQMVHVTRLAGLVVALVAVGVAVLMRKSVVKTILDYLNILGLIGISTAMGIVWRRMNTRGVFCSAALAVIAFVLTRYVLHWPREAVTGLPLLAGILGGVVGSYLGRPPEADRLEEFFTRIYVPIGQERRLTASLEEVVPSERRFLTWRGLFLVRPSRQSWVGFFITLGICLLAVLVMYQLLQA
ncbi:MAG: sodium:solute symporter family protein [Phycisphaerales bacterium]|nr:MAG: sodium:solute symporter family protein [Phycisphaerales bacterium]